MALQGTRRWRPLLTVSMLLASPVASASTPEPPADPNDAPFMRAPAGQPREARPRLKRGYNPRRRFQITLLPLYAAFNLEFLGRPRETLRGFGAGLEVDMKLLKFLWLRLQGSHSVHPVQDEFSEDADGVTLQAAGAGFIQGSHVGLGAVYAMDLGRFMPLIDAGIGGMVISTPTAVQDGQMGASCRSGAVCDMGLVCGGDNVCRPGIVMEAHVGVGVDILLRERLALGAHVRYHALLRDPATFPVYLMGAARLAIRF